MREVKTKNQIEIVRIFLYSLIILGAVLIFTAPFWHVDFPKETSEISNLRKDLLAEEKVISTEINDLMVQYDLGKIDAKEFISISDSYNEKLNELKDQNSSIISRAIDSQSIFSWKSPRAFLLGFGVRFPYVIFSLIITLLIASRRNDPKKLRISFMFLQICCWSISAYLMIWVFWSSNDYPLRTYRYALIATSILIGTSCTYFISNYRTTTSSLKSKIRFVMDLMVNKAVSKGHIKNEDKYENEIIFPALKKLDE